TALMVLLAAGPVIAGPREDALAGLADGREVEVRRRAAAALAEAGTMADAPALVAALRDADARVRGRGERALRGGGSPSGQLAVNPNLDSVRETVEALRTLLIQQRRNAI